MVNHRLSRKSKPLSASSTARIHYTQRTNALNPNEISNVVTVNTPLAEVISSYHQYLSSASNATSSNNLSANASEELLLVDGIPIFQQSVNRSSSYLYLDYIGILERIEDGETKFHDPFVRLTLKNLRGNRIRVSLWKEIIISLERFDREALDHASQPCIIAVAAVKVLKPQGWLQLNSTAATFVYINPDIEAASNMLAGYICPILS
ncbi:hypothetical protein SSX86_010937 [Deinandra increscens subsp. villosa]|uniref:Uncharacterized protein n=1 Tax=Deinandra increscens subsp. villosa TaxID=3103831 RepID=A0AAP0DCQ2_9ASTR